MLSASGSTLARHQMSHPQSWRSVVQGYCTEKENSSFRLKKSTGICWDEPVACEERFFSEYQWYQAKKCTVASYQIKKSLACRCILQGDFKRVSKWCKISHFSVLDRVKLYEKVTTFSLIFCHGVLIVKAFLSNGCLPYFGIMWCNRWLITNCPS